MMKNHWLFPSILQIQGRKDGIFLCEIELFAGLVNGTLIVEAKKKSGSLITANYAVHEGREVFAVQEAYFNPYSVGTNELIQQGAKLVNGRRYS